MASLGTILLCLLGVYVLLISFNLFLFFFTMADGSKDSRGVSERLLKKAERDKYAYVHSSINDFKILKT